MHSKTWRIKPCIKVRRFRLAFSYISFSSFIFPVAPYRIFRLFHPWLLCHFYLVIIKQQNISVLPCMFVPDCEPNRIEYGRRLYRFSFTSLESISTCINQFIEYCFSKFIASMSYGFIN